MVQRRIVSVFSGAMVTVSRKRSLAEVAEAWDDINDLADSQLMHTLVRHEWSKCRCLRVPLRTSVILLSWECCPWRIYQQLLQGFQEVKSKNCCSDTFHPQSLYQHILMAATIASILTGYKNTQRGQ